MIRLFLDETYARGAQIRYVTRTYVWLLDRRVLEPHAVGPLAVLIPAMVNMRRIEYR